MNNLQQIIPAITGFLNNVILPFLFTLAFAIFLYNAVRYFIIGSSNEEDRTKARQLALWGILAFVFLFSLWTIVGILLLSVDTEGSMFYTDPVPSDYQEKF